MRKFDIEKAAKKEFAQHEMIEIPSKSFRFHSYVPVKKYVPLKQKERVRFSPTSVYAFSLTWTPGALLLSGDVGELTLSHGYSLANFDEGIRWAAEADFDYLMGKSGVEKVYDPEKTFMQLLHDANEPLISFILGDRTYNPRTRKYVFRGGWRDELRTYRKDVVEGQQEFENERSAWERGGRQGDEPDRKDFVPEYPVDGYKIMKRPPNLRREVFGDEYPDLIIPEMWKGWMKYFRELVDGDPTSLMRSAVRRKMRSELKEMCENQQELVDFLRDIEDPDFEFSYSYPRSSRWKIAAIKHGCQMLIARGEIRPKEKAA